MNAQPIQVDLKRFELGSIKAFGDVTLQTAIGEVTIKGFRVVSKNGQPPWVSFPNTSYVKDGKANHKPLLQLRDGLHRQIEEAVLQAFNDGSRSDKG